MTEIRRQHEQRREKAIFDGQQDFGWDTGLEARVGRRREHLQRAFAEAVAEAEGALQGRRRGVRDHERAAAFGRLQELDERVRSAEAEAEAVLREAEASVAREAAELEADRRRVHEQVQALFAAAAIVRQEKAKLAEVYYAPAKEKRDVSARCLRRVRQLSLDMQGLAPAVAPELRERHSVLLYFLRVLEARLAAECSQVQVGAAEGGALHTPEVKKQLAEADLAFEAQLAGELQSLRGARQRQAARGAEQVAR
ncbi:unnamed protein product, partial [Prorocentrum cordatum]